MKTFLQWLFAVPVGLVLIVFAIVNRQAVTVVFDPFETGTPSLQVTAPLFLVLFATLAVGVIVGGSATWLMQGRHRRALRQARNEAAGLRTEVEHLRSQMRMTVPLPGRAARDRNAA